MDFGRILSELRQEKAAIEQAILSIEKLAGSHRRGRPPSSATGNGGTGTGEEAPRRRGRPKGSKNRPPAATATVASGSPPA